MSRSSSFFSDFNELQDCASQIFCDSNLGYEEAFEDCLNNQNDSVACKQASSALLLTLMLCDDEDTIKGYAQEQKIINAYTFLLDKDGDSRVKRTDLGRLLSPTELGNSTLFSPFYMSAIKHHPASSHIKGVNAFKLKKRFISGLSSFIKQLIYSLTFLPGIMMTNCSRVFSKNKVSKQAIDQVSDNMSGIIACSVTMPLNSYFCESKQVLDATETRALRGFRECFLPFKDSQRNNIASASGYQLEDAVNY